MSDLILMESDYTHVASGDNKFKARMRFHQSWYRKHVLGLPGGPNPYTKGTDTVFGDWLRPKDGADGRNFLSDAIFRVVQDRLGENRGIVHGRDQSRLLNSLLSSQPMCFNLFGPLVDDLTLATRLVGALPGLPRNIHVTHVALEYAPKKSRHLGDATSHDAFVEYELPDGGLGFIGIETKLTELFSDKSYALGEGYRRWMKITGSWWRKERESEFPNPRFNQLWRNHLLAFTMLKQEPPRYVQAHAAVLYHDDDNSCPEAMEAYRSVLRPEAQDTLLDWPLSVVLETWEKLLETAEQKSWFEDFRLRYWSLDASEEAWVAYRTGREK